MKSCPNCNSTIADDAPGGLCPRCLLAQGTGDAPTVILGAGTTGPVRAAGNVVRYFGNYELTEEVGVGGMGVVWRARQASLNRTVALKMIRGGLLADTADVARFRAEAEAAANLQHPNIVGIHEIGEQDGQHYYSMEFIQGRSLHAACDGKPMEPMGAAQLLATVADAVEFAHRAQILHRDLKPHNVMMDADGVPHLTDFGLAKRMDMDSGMTQTGAIMGSPSYMAPEQAQGRNDDVGPRTDVYSLGAILYQTLTGRPPFQAATALDTVRQVVDAEPAPPRSVNASVPADLETICLKCLEKDPARRYASAREFADELGRFLRGEPILARPIGFIGRTAKWARRKPAIAALAAIVTLLVSALAIGSTIAAVRIATARNDAVAQKNIAQGALAESEDRGRKIIAEQGRTLAALHEQKRQTAQLTLQQGVNLAERGDAGRGLLWMARSLTAAKEAGDAQLEHAIRESIAGWRPRGHEMIASWAPQFQARSVAISADGRRVLLGLSSGMARLLDLETGALTGPAIAHGSEAVVVTFSGDGKRIAIAGKNRTVLMYDAATGAPAGLPVAADGDISRISLNHDGSRLLLAKDSGPTTGVLVFDVASGQAIGRPLKHGGLTWIGFARLAALSPDGKLAFTSPADFLGQFWNVDTGEPFREAIRSVNQSYSRWFLDMAFSPDGSLVALVGSDRTVRTFEAATLRETGPALRHGAYTRFVRFSDDGTRIVASSEDRKILVWDVATRRQIGPALELPNHATGIAFADGGRTVVATSGPDTSTPATAIHRWRLAAPETPHQIFRAPFPVWHAQILPDGGTLLTTGEDDLLRFWSMESGGSIESVKVPSLGHGHGLALAADARLLVLGSCGNWANGVSGKPIQHDPIVARGIQVPSLYFANALFDVSLSRDATRAAGSGNGAMAKVYDVTTGAQIGKTMRHSKKQVGRTSLHPDGHILLTGGDDATARLWDVETGSQSGQPIEHPDVITAARFHPDGRHFLTGAGDQIFIWDLAARRRIGDPLNVRGRVTFAEFSRDGSRIVTTSADRAQVWDFASRKPIGPPMIHDANVDIESARFSPDGTRVSTAGWDKTARVWPTPGAVTGTPDQVERWAEAITGLRLAPDGGIEPLPAPAWMATHATVTASGLPAPTTFAQPDMSTAPLDLLSLVALPGSVQDGHDPKDGGSWSRLEDGALRSPRRVWARVDLPANVTGNYRFKVRFTPHKGDHKINVLLPVADRHYAFVVHHGGWRGLDSIGGIRSDNPASPARVPDFKLVPEKVNEFAFSIRLDGDKTSIAITHDGKPLLTWSGVVTDLDPSFWVPRRGHISLVPWVTQTDFHEATLTLGL